MKKILLLFLACFFMNFQGFSQENEITITGVVKDSDGMLLPQVSVLEKNTTNGVGTDFDGNYSIEVRSDAVLVFSYMGYESQEVPVNGQTIINVTLNPDFSDLEEVVVIGYGERKRESITGSVSTVGAEAMESLPITNTASALQGSLPGLVVQRNSGQPGAEAFSFNIRGISSVNGNNAPLILIDGIPGDLNLINPADISNISVLKDGAASIYGARAANGVVLVTTKEGKIGGPHISISTNIATTKLDGMMETPSNLQMALMDNEANIHNGSAPLYTPEMIARLEAGDPNPIPHPIYGGWMLFFNNTDWREAVFENGFQHKEAVSISGAGEKTRYYLSGSFSDQEGVIKYADDDNKRYNLRLNYDYDLFDFMTLETKVSLDDQVRTDIGGASAAGVMYETIFGMPNHPIYTQDGQHYFAQGGWGNAVAMAKEAETSVFKTRNLNTNFKLITDFNDDLRLNLQAGINHIAQDNKDIGKGHPLYNWDASSIAYYSIANPDQNWLLQYDSETTYRNFSAYLEYDHVFDEKHRLDLMVGASHEENDFDWKQASRSNFLTDNVWSLGLGSTDNMDNNGGGSHWAIQSLFSRLSYSFKEKYILEGNFRYDGSSRFHKDSRWGFFPGVSAGWILSKEDFLSDSKFVDLLKLRASYGETGNQDGIDLYDYYQLITIGRGYPYPFGPGRRDQSAFLSGMVSLDRTWETVSTSNIGLDANFLNSRLDFSFDYFVKRNEDMLVPIQYPSLLGAEAPFTNAGELKTWGFETSLGWNDNIGDFDYAVNLNLSDAKNEVIRYGGTDTYVLGLNSIREGYPINTYFAYEFDGLIRNEEELAAYRQLGGVPNDIGIGDARFKDLNGDGVISPYSDTPGEDGDVINVGNTTPRYTYGLNMDLKYKNFDFSLFLQGVGKRTLFRVGEYSMPWSDWWRQPPLFYFEKTWSEDRPDARYPKLTHGSIRHWNYQPSTLQKENAAYLRLKNIQIGYSLPESVLKVVNLSKARVYFSGFDLWETHKMRGGWDPESSTTGFNYPFQRLYSLGLDINL